MIELKVLLPKEVRSEWGKIRVGLERATIRFSGGSPEDIYMGVMNGNTFLFRVLADGNQVGVIALQHLKELEGPVLFIWALCVDDNALGKTGLDNLLPVLAEMARKAGAQALRWHSQRRGWEGIGYRVKYYVYEQEVTQ